MDREVVVIASGSESRFDLLDAVLDQAGLPELLETIRGESGKTKPEFLVVIKPNLAMFFKDTVTITDPELAVHLVDRLHDLGYPRVVIGEAQNTFLKWLDNRDIVSIARAAGYRFRTPKGRAYDVVDLADDCVTSGFPPEHSLAGVPVSRLWKEADFRISFAKNKTHEEYFYTLCLKNLLGALPLADKHLHYHSRLKVWDVCWELHQTFPAHFSIIDGYISNHGNVGSQVLNPIETKTIIGGRNILLVDWVGAIKMGIDPYLSPLNSKALKVAGLPVDYEVIGSLAPYEGWRNIHPLLSDSFFRLDEAEAITRLFWPASFIVDSRLFPWKRRLFKWINAVISPVWARVDRWKPFLWMVIWINYWLVLIFFMKRVWRTLFDRKELRRKEPCINVAADRFSESDYEALPAFMRPMEEIVQALPKRRGSCHTFVDGGILYHVHRDVDYPFDEFVSGVDICKAVSYMHDYIGGRAVQVRSDIEGRCIHQLERTVFLPQPNASILLNGTCIDVTKIERIEYGTDHRKMIWRTFRSDNDSAVYDDGTVTFRRKDDRTRVEITVHQAFRQAPGLRWLRLDYYPGLRRAVMVPAFRRFFDKTMRNYCSVAEGKYRPLGRPWVRDGNAN